MAIPTFGRTGLFAYGTLQFPEVLDALLDRVPEIRPAALVGWRAARLHGLSYPGLTPGGGPAPGVLLTGLSQAEWRILDAYEDEEYDLVAVQLADTAPALAYRYRRTDLLLEQDWSAAEFAGRDLPDFAESCRQWRLSLAW